MEAYIGASNERLPPICGARPFSEKFLPSAKCLSLLRRLPI